MERSIFQETDYSKPYFLVSKKLLNNLGPNTTFLFCLYMEESDKNSHLNNGWIYLPHKIVCEILCMSLSEVRTSKKKLMAIGLIFSKQKGFPAKEYIRILFF